MPLDIRVTINDTNSLLQQCFSSYKISTKCFIRRENTCFLIMWVHRNTKNFWVDEHFCNFLKHFSLILCFCGSKQTNKSLFVPILSLYSTFYKTVFVLVFLVVLLPRVHPCSNAAAVTVTRVLPTVPPSSRCTLLALESRSFSNPFLFYTCDHHICLHTNLTPLSPLLLIAFTVVRVPQLTFLLLLLHYLIYPPPPLHSHFDFI